MKTILLSILTLFVFSATSIADEIRMSYLGVKETSNNNFSITFKIPIKANKKLNLNTNLLEHCKLISKVESTLVSKAYLNTFNLECSDGLIGKNIEVSGLKVFNTDLLLQIKLLNGSSQTILFTPDKASYTIPEVESSLNVISTYTLLGIEHILEGFDHLLFVFALLLIVKNIRTLIWTITAFTLAHSITLAGASLGYLSLPGPPVEAIIALSILFLAMEVVHQKRGKEGIASKFPWLVSFTFGLLHGFGFAGALSDIGLPQESISLALLFFNVGVEIGQLMFVSAVLLVGFILQKLNQKVILERGQVLVIYLIGSLSSFWLIERVSGF